MKINKRRVMFSIVILSVLIFAYFYGGGYAEKNSGDGTTIPETSASSGGIESSDPASGDHATTGAFDSQPGEDEPATGENPTAVQVAPPAQDSSSGQNLPPAQSSVNEEPSSDSNPVYSCTVSVRCDTVLNHLDSLDSNKLDIIPKDGVILASTRITFEREESVFDVLKRATKQNGIHLEFTGSSAYGSAYIEGIGNLYEFDCGELSGWSYKVNGSFPAYGCSLYELSEGDKVEWVYTCDLGRDVGGGNYIGSTS
jgi:hypothetical protein